MKRLLKKISTQKAHLAKNIIGQSLMNATNGSLREKIANAKSNSNNSLNENTTTPGFKSKTVDPSTIRAYAERMAIAKMSPQERWENMKLTEPEVQSWEKSIEAKKRDDEAALKKI